MGLSATTQKVIKLVEEKTGFPVHVEPDSSLPPAQLARVVVARADLHLHRILHRPDASADYLICHQCGFILRLFSVPPDERFELTFAEQADEEIRRLVERHPLIGQLPAEAAATLVKMLRDGLLNHLRSTPVGMRVDEWIAADFPELADLQRRALLRELEDAATTLAPRFRQVSPDPIYRPTQVISAAFAQFWAGRLNQAQIALPYKAAGFLPAGEGLLAIWHSIPGDAGHDRQLVDAWAEKLGLANWHRWVPYSTPS